MTTIGINYITESGACVYGQITLSQDWTMCELVNRLREMNVKSFRINGMTRFAEVM